MRFRNVSEHFVCLNIVVWKENLIWPDVTASGILSFEVYPLLHSFTRNRSLFLVFSLVTDYVRYKQKRTLVNSVFVIPNRSRTTASRAGGRSLIRNLVTCSSARSPHWYSVGQPKSF